MDENHYEQAELWGAEHVADPQSQQRRLADTAAFLPDAAGRMLDVGAGDGRFRAYLEEHGLLPELFVCAERSASALRHASGARVQSAAQALPFSDRSFKTVAAFEVFEHLPHVAYRTVRDEMARVADDYIVVTVPNREDIVRSQVVCRECRCRFNPDRHNRSFRPDVMGELFDGFELVETRDLGPPAYRYPRFVRLGAERIGLLARPGSPTCPQCGTTYRTRRSQNGDADRSAPSSPTPTSSAAPTGGKATGAIRSLPRRGYRVARRFVPRTRWGFWLGAVYRRR